MQTTMTVFRGFSRDIILKKCQAGIGNNQTSRGVGLAKTLENIMATPMLHRPSIRHRDGEANHRWLVLTSVKPPHQATSSSHLIKPRPVVLKNETSDLRRLQKLT
jgi:hypothetical protein